TRSSRASNTTTERSSGASPCWPNETRMPPMIKGAKEETVSAWLIEAAPQMERIEQILLRDHKMSRAKLDTLWTCVGHKGEKKDFRKKTAAAHSAAG
ncbi:MAG: hypothetical protein J2P21_07165, partial [Chloracidobacterium sp.]|nr:hypothetical protein [Chloracidobacterium sp.]